VKLYVGDAIIHRELFFPTLWICLDRISSLIDCSWLPPGLLLPSGWIGFVVVIAASALAYYRCIYRGLIKSLDNVVRREGGLK